MKHTQYLLCSLALVAFATAAKANIVTNSDFSPANASYYGPVAGWTQSPFPSTLGGYPYLTGSNDSSGPFWDNGSTGGATTVGFIQVYPGEPTDSLSQTLTLILGKTYMFSYLENARSTAAVDVSVLIGGSTLVASHLDSAVGGSNPFNLITGTFVATSTSEDLSFIVNQVNGGDDGTALITDVSAVPTPEPSSLALLGTGIFGVIGVARRKFFKA